MTMDPTLPARRVVIRQFAETPEEAIAGACWEACERPVCNEGEVRIAIRAAGVNWVDLLMACGLYQHVPEPPYCPGLEYAGIVDEVGAGVSQFALGDRVLIDPFRTGPRSSGNYRSYGGYAEYALAPSEAVMMIPKALGFAEACNLLGNVETAYFALKQRAKLSASDTVLILGATGATGLAAVQIAKLLGAKVIATGRTWEKLCQLGSLGADHLLAIGDGDGGVRRFRDEVKELTDGRGVDVVYDGVGGDVSLEALRCVRFGARYLIVGWAATPFVSRGKGKGAPRANMLPTNLMLIKGLDVLGCPTVIASARNEKVRGERVTEILKWAEDGRLTPFVSQTFSMDRFADAMLAKWQGRIVGGCAIVAT